MSRIKLKWRSKDAGLLRSTRGQSSPANGRNRTVCRIDTLTLRHSSSDSAKQSIFIYTSRTSEPLTQFGLNSIHRTSAWMVLQEKCTNAECQESATLLANTLCDNYSARPDSQDDRALNACRGIWKVKECWPEGIQGRTQDQRCQIQLADHTS